MNKAALILALQCIALCGSAKAADEALLLEVTLNGRATQLIGQFTLRDGAIFASRSELTELGIKLPVEGGDLLPLSRFSNEVRFDQQAQQISINVPTEFLSTTELSVVSASASDLPLSDSGVGAVFNYDILANKTDDVQTVSGLFDARVYSNSGVFGTSALGYLGPIQTPSVRLDSSYTYSDPQSLRRVRVGDYIGNGLAWTRPVRLGGVQVSTDFSLRPDLVLFPTPTLRGEAVVPSSVDLFVNGARQFSQAVTPGPFEIRQAPIASGAGTIAVAVTDALGRQSFQNVPFYTSGRMLKEGLLSYSIDTGWVRKNYGVASDDYGDSAVSTSARYGYSSLLTVEGHAEAMRGLALAGGGVIGNIGNFGILSASASASNSSTGSTGKTSGTAGSPTITSAATQGAGAGNQVSLGFERSARNVSFALSKTQASPGYRDIGALEGSAVLRSTVTASIGLSNEKYGSINAAYTAVKLPNNLDATIDGSSDTRILSVSYFKSLFNRATLFVSGFKSLQGNSTNVTVGLIVPIGARDVVGFSSNGGSGAHSNAVQASRATVSPGDIGWQLQDSEGAFVQRSAELAYKGTHGRSTLGFSQNGSQTSQRIGVRGAVAVANNSVFLTNWIDDSFAVVDAGDLKGIGIFAENRYAGRTDKDGQLLVPDLRSYDTNRIAIDPLDLPVDADVSLIERMIKPRDRSGVVVKFDTRQSGSARVILTNAAGEFLPVGSSVTVVESGLRAPVGYDGETYLSQLTERNTVRAQLPSGAHCETIFPFTAKRDTIIVIGPLVCR